MEKPRKPKEKPGYVRASLGKGLLHKDRIHGFAGAAAVIRTAGTGLNESHFIIHRTRRDIVGGNLQVDDPNALVCQRGHGLHQKRTSPAFATLCWMHGDGPDFGLVENRVGDHEPTFDFEQAAAGSGERPADVIRRPTATFGEAFGQQHGAAFGVIRHGKITGASCFGGAASAGRT